MTGMQATRQLIEEAQIAFAADPYRDIRFPALHDSGSPFHIPAVWTLDATHPRWDNLAVLTGTIDPHTNHPLEFWQDISTTFAPRLTVLAGDDHYVLLFQQAKHEIRQQTISPTELRQTLAAQREALFAPNRRATLQLDRIFPGDSFHSRYRTRLQEALSNALTGALQLQQQVITKTTNQAEAVYEVIIAYLAARILSDKGLLAPNPTTYAPHKLILQTIEHTNGAPQQVYNEHLPTMHDAVLQHLITHLGPNVTFALVDDQDIGILYEQSILVLNDHKQQTTLDLLARSLTTPPQYDIPIAIADQLLATLPLERLPPAERIIYDPAAGSGTLLLAATRRLAAMRDIQLLDTASRRTYLASHVIGNDIAPSTKLIAQVRYALLQKPQSQTLPFPLQFTHQSIANNQAWPTTSRPRIIVANLSLPQRGRLQTPAPLLAETLKHMQQNDQFAFILPQHFFTATTNGWQSARTFLTEHVHILETWQFSEQDNSLYANPPTCIVSGIVNEPETYSLARTIISGAAQNILLERGFLGQARITMNNAEQWQAPPIQEHISRKKQLNEGAEIPYQPALHSRQLFKTGEIPLLRTWLHERQETPIAVTGQVLEIDAGRNQILLYLEGLLEEDTEAWVPLPPELPGWALDGTVFSAELSETVTTFADLRQRPWALRNVQHTPTPYLSLNEIKEELFTHVEEEPLCLS